MAQLFSIGWCRDFGTVPLSTANTAGNNKVEVTETGGHHARLVRRGKGHKVLSAVSYSRVRISVNIVSHASFLYISQIRFKL